MKKNTVKLLNSIWITVLLVLLSCLSLYLGLLFLGIVLMIFAGLAVMGGIYNRRDYRRFLELQRLIGNADLEKKLQILSDDENYSVWLAYASGKEIGELKGMFFNMPRNHPQYWALASLISRISEDHR